MDFVFLCGRALGELAQGEAMAFYLQKQNIKYSFIIPEGATVERAKRERLPYFISNGPKKTNELLEKLKPDVLVLCNSKTSRFLIEKPPSKKPLVVSLDSNWLFSQSPKWKVFDWIDAVFVVMPKKIFQNGLKKFGGHYKISHKWLNRISSLGFVPSAKPINNLTRKLYRKKIGLIKNQKMIFAYFGKGHTYKEFLTSKLFNLIDELNKNKIRIKVMWIGPKINVNKKWLIKKYETSNTELDQILTSADVVVQHHGLATLAKLIFYRTPVICFVAKFLQKNNRTFKNSSAFEMAAFEKEGVCKKLFYDCDKALFKNTLLDLLYNQRVINKMKYQQKKYSIPGEKKIFLKIKKIIKLKHNKQ